jgi:hypothetical protein
MNIHSFGPKPVRVPHLFSSVTGIRVYVLCVVKFSVVENLVGNKKEEKKTNYLFCFRTRDAK